MSEPRPKLRLTVRNAGEPSYNYCDYIMRIMSYDGFKCSEAYYDLKDKWLRGELTKDEYCKLRRWNEIDCQE